MEKDTVVTIDLPLDIVHKLYGLAIFNNCTIDDVVNNILKEEIENLKNKE